MNTITAPSIVETYHRYKTLHSHVVSALPVVILMPHSACNCRCVMCDIWKDNKNLKQLTEPDIEGLLSSLKKFNTHQVVMSGGEALLNKNFFRLCGILKSNGMKVSLLTTGLSLKDNAENLLKWVDDVIVSLDGDQQKHDEIRNIPKAFKKLEDGVKYLKSINPHYRITVRSVIHRLNFRNWQGIIDAAKEMGADQLSFLPADVSSHAFNRQTAWAEPRQHEILISEKELPELQEAIYYVLTNNTDSLHDGFFAESAIKIQNIYQYYAAFYNLNPFPYKKCNAPWVSAVIEADGSVRPCFFHDFIGNIHENSLNEVLNGEKGLNFRKKLDMSTNDICVKCVCSLNLSPLAKLT